MNDINGLKHRQSESAKNNIGGNVAGKANLNTISNDKYPYKTGQKKNGQDVTASKPLNKLKVNAKEDSKKKDQTKGDITGSPMLAGQKGMNGQNV